MWWWTQSRAAMAAGRIQVNAAIALAAGDDLAGAVTVEQLVAQTQSAAIRVHSIVQSTDAKLGSIRTIDLSGDSHASSTTTINLTGITGAIATTLMGVAGAGTTSRRCGCRHHHRRQRD